MKNILIVEDDPQITKILKINLRLNGYDTDSETTFQGAWSKVIQQSYDLILMDIGLPDGSGLDLCQKIRDSGNNVPIIFLSARTDEMTVVKGIKNGADDYLRKPFGLEELKARISKFISERPSKELIVCGQLKIDPACRVATLMGQVITLGKKELDILILLARKAGDIVTRENILSSIYDHPDMYDRTIDSHMSHLRKKIREISGRSLKISSVYGLGYRLEWN